MGVALTHAEINFLILERHGVGASFARWPDEMRLITPSFPPTRLECWISTPSPLGCQRTVCRSSTHGKTIRSASGHGRRILRVAGSREHECTKLEVEGVFHIDTGTDTIKSKHVIWAAGEYQYPRMTGLEGIENCRHTATIDNYESIEGDDFIVVGGYESGVDVAYHLARRGKRVRLIDRECPWDADTDDPSVALSTYSLERSRTEYFTKNVELIGNTTIQSVTHEDGVYEVTAENGETFRTPSQPLWAGGFVKPPTRRNCLKHVKMVFHC